MALLKKSAESGNAESQNSFALHIYNGYNITKDRNSAIRYFELATEKGNEAAKLWLSLILIREGRDVKKAASYLSQVASSPTSKVPEALSLYGQQLASQGSFEEASSILLSASQLGSISAI